MKGIKMMTQLTKYFFALSLAGFLNCELCPAMQNVCVEPCGYEGREIISLVVGNNPCYPEYSEISDFVVSNGAVVNFSADGAVGAVIRGASTFNDIQNPYGITHSGVVVLGNPLYMFEIIRRRTRCEENADGTIETAAGHAMLNEFLGYFGSQMTTVAHHQLHPFLLEANGTADDVLNGIYPHVQLHPLLKSVRDYPGNVYLRNVIVPVSLDYCTRFVEDHIGRSYEKLSTIFDLVRAVGQRNAAENTENLFCSELVALFYRGAIKQLPPSCELTDLLSRLGNVSNIIPEQLSCGAGYNDVLRSIASGDLALKDGRR
jgi:hypothetical protein